ncbi:hypothetical protein SUDANB121_00898 [Nocardiopsis dassonvillei]|uniref:hypothetical protein n=1 Tax=Nocardiopsis dassonvillei TaxID=2014 RepID=UPI003F54A585
MGLGKWLGKRFGGGGEPPAHGSPQELAELERRELAAVQRECDRIHAGLVEMYSLLPADRRPDLAPEPPRFASREEAQAYMERMRTLLKRR